MIVETLESGLVVPVQPPQVPPKPHRFFGPLEMRDESRREKAIRALLDLWDALDLSSGGGGIRTQSQEQYEAHYQAYNYIGKMILGGECPEKEVKT